MTESRERDRRVYYQDIVYEVCNLLDELDGKSVGTGLVCGTIDFPRSEVQDRLGELVAEVQRLRSQ